MADESNAYPCRHVVGGAEESERVAALAQLAEDYVGLRARVDAANAPYAGPNRRVLNPRLPAFAATSYHQTRDTQFFVQTGEVLLEVACADAQRTTVLLHNLANGHAHGDHRGGTYALRREQ